MNIFTKHPHSIGESYFEHLKFAGLFGINMLLGGCACLIHAIFPFLFQNTGSHFLLKMTHKFVERMPTPTAPVINISQVIEKKLKKNAG